MPISRGLNTGNNREVFWFFPRSKLYKNGMTSEVYGQKVYGQMVFL